MGNLYAMQKHVKLAAFILVIALLSTVLPAATPVKADITTNSFAARVSFSTNLGPTSVETGDLDGDGKPEIAVTNYGSTVGIGNTVSVLRNTSSSGNVAFASKLDLAAIDGPHELVMGDIDNDGKSDIVASNFGIFASGDTISVFRNTSTSGNLSFAAKVDFVAVTRGPMGVVVGDVDGDGLRDVIVNEFDDGRGSKVWVLRNTSTVGNISFAPKLEFTVGTGPYGVEMGDLDGDGKPELVVANNGSFAGEGNTVSILRNTSTAGNVSFAPKADFGTNNGPRGAAIGDIDGDGKPDVLISHFGGSGSGTTVSALRNTSSIGNLSFAPKVDSTVNNGAIRIVIGDIDKDGKLDAAVANFGTVGSGAVIGATTSVLRNTSTPGAISFAPKVDFATGNGPHGLAIGDIDGDTWLDLVSGDYGSFSGDGNTVSVLRNTGNTGSLITVPNVVGATQAAAQTAITTAGLAVGSVTQAYNNSVPAGSVISQNPAAGTSVSSGSAVGLVVSLGPAPSNVTVPNVVGLTQAAAQTAITNAGLVVGTVSQANSSSVPAGNVISQTPAANTSVASGSAVNLVVSTGPAPVSVPNVVGLTQAAAQTAITNAGLIVGAVTQANSSSVPAGSVISQTPVANTSVAPGSAVDLVISLGPVPNNVTVPNVVGLTQAAAQTAITNAGLTAGTVTQAYNNSVPVGSVISQNPVAGASVAQNAAVSLVVSLGPAPGNLNITGSSFAAKVDFGVNAGATGLVHSDLDADGKVDLAVANYGAAGSIGTTVSVLRNIGSGGNVAFAPKVDLATNDGPMSIAAGDIDGDGKADLAVTDYGPFGSGNKVSVLRNTSTSGNISFAAKVDFTISNGLMGIAIGDVDGDGKADIVVTQFNEGNGTLVSVLRNTSSSGTVSFAAKVDFSVNTGPVGVAIGDLDGDGKADVVVTNNGSFAGSGNTVSVLRNTSTNGNVSFAAKVDFATNNGPRGVVLGDIDGDGKLDVAIANFGDGSSGNTVSILRNTSTSGTIALASKIDLPVGNGALNVGWGDLNNDGKFDLAVTNFSSGNISMLQNTSTSGNIAFATKVDFATNAGPFGITVADLDGDSWLDAAAANYGSGAGNLASVLRNLLGSSGSSNATVPNVVGLTQAAAQTAITNAGLVVGTVTQASSSSVPAGSVISQNPAASVSVAGGSAVNFVVSSGPALVTVPNVVGLTQAAAQTAITNAGLVVGTVTQANSSSVPAGSVISQTPAANTSVASGSAVNLVVSTGPAPVSVPNVVGLTQAAAQTAITNAGLVVGTVTQANSSSVPAGSVISQTPTAGTSVASGSAVNLVISSGPAPVAVPNVVGLTQTAAQTTITNAGLVVGTVTQASSNSVPAGSVISQSPTAGTSVAAGSAVNLVISSGPPPVTVPNVVGLTQTAAQTSITNAGLVVGTVTQAYNNTVAAGSVISQSPASGTSVASGSAVNLVVSLGRPPLTVTKAGSGSGTVTSSPTGINCGTTCSTVFNLNTVVTLSASPAAGSTFTGWSGACTGTGTCSVTMSTARNVTATFSDVIFADGFESGNFSAWSASVTDLGDLSVSTTAALVGAMGMRVVVDDNVAIYVTDTRPAAETRYRARFYFDPNSITMSSGDTFVIFVGYSGASTQVLHIDFNRSTTSYQLRSRLTDSFGVSRATAWVNISDAPHFVEFDWRAATFLGAANGSITLWIDGVQVGSITGVNNAQVIDSVRFGATGGIDTGTRGTYYLDAFESRRSSLIGSATTLLAANVPDSVTMPTTPESTEPSGEENTTPEDTSSSVQMIYMPVITK